MSTVRIYFFSCKRAGLVLSLCMLVACDPVSLIMGGTAAVGGIATREKGVSGTASDTWISAKVKNKLYQFNPELHASVGVNVQNGEVLLTGSVSEESWVQEAERLAREVEGVKTILNHLGVKNSDLRVGEIASDSLITTELKSHLLCDGDIRSLNYSVKTVGGTVYVMGTAQDAIELEKVLNYARNIKGVVKVISYAQIKTSKI